MRKENEKNYSSDKKKYIVSGTLAGVLVLFIVIMNILVHIDGLAEWLTREMSRKINYLISRITSFVPFSVFETFVVIAVIVSLFLIGYIIYSLVKKRFTKVLDIVIFIVIFILILVAIFNVSATPSYYRDDLMDAMGIERVEGDEALLVEALQYYINELNSAARELQDEYGDIKSAYNGYEIQDISKSIFDEYDRLDTGGYLAGYRVRVKEITFSNFMSYTGIVGISVPHTQEVNINRNTYPSALPVVIAHEIAHNKGVQRENDANFLAYYITIHSDNARLRYSGLNELVSRLLYELKRVDKELFNEYYERVDESVRRDWQEESEYYDKYEGVIESISTFINNLFLKSNGIEGGVTSYSDTTEAILSMYVHDLR